MALLALQQVTAAGLAPSYSAATSGAGGDTFPPDDHGFVHVKNASGGAITVTIDIPGTALAGAAITDPTVSVGAGADKFIGPFNTQFMDPTTGVCKITYSAVTSVTVAALRA